MKEQKTETRKKSHHQINEKKVLLFYDKKILVLYSKMDWQHSTLKKKKKKKDIGSKQCVHVEASGTSALHSTVGEN